MVGSDELRLVLSSTAMNCSPSMVALACPDRVVHAALRLVFEGAKFWLAMLSEITNRGVEDVCIVFCDGLKGSPSRLPPCSTTRRCRPHLAPEPQHLPLRRPQGLE